MPFPMAKVFSPSRQSTVGRSITSRWGFSNVNMWNVEVALRSSTNRVASPWWPTRALVTAGGAPQAVFPARQAMISPSIMSPRARITGANPPTDWWLALLPLLPSFVQRKYNILTFALLALYQRFWVIKIESRWLYL